MKHLLTFQLAAVGGLLLCAASAATALTLGRARGAALIGKPLDVAIQATFDGGTDTASMCLAAEVFQGDARIADGRVTAQLESVSGTAAVVRVRTAVAVEEPVVTLYLRAGCGQGVTRRYVLLAEPAGDAPAVAAVPPVPNVTVAPPAAVPGTAGAALSPPASRSTRGVPATSPSLATAPAQRRVRREADSAVAAQPERAAPAARAARSLGQGKPPAPRLKLEPLDLAAERDPTLRASASIDTVPEATTEQRARAAALWKALNAGPEDMLRNAQRMEALEGDMKLLRQQIQANNASLSDLRTNLERARAERYSNGLVYALLALLVLAVTALIYRWRNGSRDWQPEWWRAREPDGNTALGAEPVFKEEPAPAPAVAHAAAGAELDLDLDVSQPASQEAKPGDDVRAARAQLNAWARSGIVDFQHSQPASMRSVKAEELNDVQQQADFFISLGEYEQAINVLMGHIHANPQTSALAWLDLLDLHHWLKRREGYEALREQFQQRFNVQVPPFESYQEPTAGLEAYDDALLRICALWPSSRVLDVIEESIFRKPGSHGGEPFDLAAYRDLLLLYNIGKEVIDYDSEREQWDSSAGDSVIAQEEFSSTSIMPLSVSIPQPAWRVKTEDLPPIPMLPDEVDIDLGSLDAAPEDPPAVGDASAASASQDGNLIEFDAFDDATARLPRRNTPK